MANRNYMRTGLPTGIAPMALDLATPMRALTDRMVGLEKERISKEEKEFDENQKALIEALSFETVVGASEVVQQKHLENVGQLWDKYATVLAENDGKLSMAGKAQLMKDKHKINADLARMQTDVQQFEKIQEIMLDPKYDAAVDKNAMRDKVAQYYKDGKIGSGDAWGLIVPRERSIDEKLEERYGQQFDDLEKSYSVIIPEEGIDTDLGTVQSQVVGRDKAENFFRNILSEQDRAELVEAMGGDENKAIDYIYEKTGGKRVADEFNAQLYRYGNTSSLGRRFGWTNLKTAEDEQNTVHKNNIIEGVWNLDENSLITAAAMFQEAYDGEGAATYSKDYRPSRNAHVVTFQTERNGKLFPKEVEIKIGDNPDKKQDKITALNTITNGRAFTGKYSINEMNIEADWQPTDGRTWRPSTEWKGTKRNEILGDNGLGSKSQLSLKQTQDLYDKLRERYAERVERGDNRKIIFDGVEYKMNSSGGREALRKMIEADKELVWSGTTRTTTAAPDDDQKTPVDTTGIARAGGGMRKYPSLKRSTRDTSSESKPAPNDKDDEEPVDLGAIAKGIIDRHNSYEDAIKALIEVSEKIKTREEAERQLKKLGITKESWE